MMRPGLLALAATFATFAASPALAQGALGAGIPMNQENPKTQDEIDRQKATEEAYKKTMKTIPNAKPVDPWGSVRDDKPKSQGTQAHTGNKTDSKAAKKTGTAAN